MSSIPISQQRQKSRTAQIWHDLTDFDVLSIFERKRKPPTPRTVLVNQSLPDIAWKPTKQGQKELKAGKHEDDIARHTGTKVAPEWEYPTNQVLTSKYNILTFIPKNLLEQFRRVANIFFLALVILQAFPRFANVSIGLAALPLIVVLAITALKDGYEDVKRHQSDRFINNIAVHVLHGDHVHNPNLTEPKTKGLSMKGFSNFLDEIPYFGPKRLAKRALKESEQVEEDDEIIIPERKRFWGRKVRSVSVGEKDRKKVRSRSNTRASSLDPTRGNGPPISTKTSDPEKGAPTRTPSQDSTELTIFDGENRDEHAPHWKAKTWEDLRVGDFVRLRDNDSVPADIIICSTSEEENVCYVETKNLDGETNLKSRNAVPELTHIRSARDAHEAKFLIKSEAPDVNMFRYSAAVEMHDGRMGKDGQPLRATVNLGTTLLRGCVIRNTGWVIGVVVFTGIDTKIVLNSGGTPSKRGKIERQMNYMVFANLALLAVMCTFCAIGDHFTEVYYNKRNAPWQFRADRSSDNPNINGLVAFANALITFQNIVPISLYISIEFVRTVQAFFIWADDDIYYQPTKRRTLARSWNLSDDLGQIQYVFSDKTGTLTQNSMEFRQCSIGGKVYKSDDDNESATATRISESTDKAPGETKERKPAADAQQSFHSIQMIRDLDNSDNAQAQRISAFMKNLALCHTVLAADDGQGNLEYKAQSPDEAALVQAAADAGFVFRGRDKDVLRITVPGSKEPLEYDLLNVLDFTSARKRMSVIVRPHHEAGKILLLCKGADNVIFERSAPGHDEQKKVIDGHLEFFASEGLRTLTLAQRELTTEEYEDWDKRYHDASVAVENREEKVEEVASSIETNLSLLGATAIEDKLQDGVPEAIGDLKRAGIKVWVATGDKLETAIAIGMSSNLLTPDMNLIIIRGGAYNEEKSAQSQMENALSRFFGEGEELVNNMRQRPACQAPNTSKYQRRPSGLDRSTTAMSGMSDIVDEDNGFKPGGYGLVIDGASLTHAFDEVYTKELLLELAIRCQSVVCCRVSPLQKALIVRLVKDGLNEMCLAIGDGANDVSMIQAADVGVGVAGEEGLQAVNSSDYAIGQFRYLNRLLFVHGHWSYIRNSSMICNFFYKEIIGIGILFFFQFYCLYSTTTVYEYTYILFWNVFWTLLPVLAIGIFDRDINDRVLMEVPELYQNGREGRLFGMKRFCWYMLDGIYQSAICFFFILYTYAVTTAREDGWDVSLYEFSTIMAIAAVIAANVYNTMNIRAWNWWVVASGLVGCVLVLCWTALYSAISPGWIWTYMWGMNKFLWPSAYFWFGAVFAIVLSLLPRYCIMFYRRFYRAGDIDTLRVLARTDPTHDFRNDPRITPHAKKQDESDLGRHTSRSSLQPPMPIQEPIALHRLGSRGRTMTDMSDGLVRHTSRGFDFDPPVPWRKRAGTNGKNGGRARGMSIKLFGAEIPSPSLSRFKPKRHQDGSSSPSKAGRSRADTTGTRDTAHTRETSEEPLPNP